jgi:hypothetical protein
MRRSGLVLFFLSVAATASLQPVVAQQRQLQQQGQPQQPPPPPALQQTQGVITDFYVSEFRNGFSLSDEQFIKLNPPLRRFMMQRFKLAIEKANVNQQIERLAATPNPPGDEVDMLLMEKSRIDRQMVNAEQALLEMIRVDLSPQQMLKVSQFNKRFFEDQLPKLIEQAKNNPRPQPPPDRPNQAKQQNRGNQRPANGPIDAFQRGKQP